GSKRVDGQVLAFSAVVVTEERETALIQALEQQHSAMWPSFSIDGRQGHGIRLNRQLFGLHRIGKPLLEQRKRLKRRLRLAQTVTGVSTEHVSQDLSHRQILLGKCV